MSLYSASRHVDLPADTVFEIAANVENLIWIKGVHEPTITRGDGRTPGSTFRAENLLGDRYDFEVVEWGGHVLRFRGLRPTGILDGELVVEGDEQSCLVTWTQRDRADHAIERLLVFLAGPLGRRASVRDAETELKRLERVVNWVLGGRKGAPFMSIRD